VTTSAIYQDLVSITAPLDSIYLDPNNPRFVGISSKWVEDSDIDLEKIQDEARTLLVRDYEVDKLRMNMEVNGYLPMDRIVVRRFKPELTPAKYVVLEGNRRVAAAKMIGAVAMDGSTVAQEVLRSLEQIPCLEYVGTDQGAAWIFQGLRHITGISEWSAYNKARLLVEQMEEDHLSLTSAGKRFGLTPFGAGQWVRGYYAFKQAREESDYIREVDERSYPYFQELFGRSSMPVRDWMVWNEDELKFKDGLKFNEFIGWLYPRPRTDEADSEVRGNFDTRRLSRRDDIRTVAWLITNAQKQFEHFRSGAAELEVAYATATAEALEKKSADSVDRVTEVFEAINAAIKALDTIPAKMLRQAGLKQQLEEKIDKLSSLIEELGINA
jgi:hypothetical protein